MIDIIHHSPVASVIFAVTIVTSLMAFQDPILKSRFLLHPFSLVREKKYYALITSGLIHGDTQHLLFNMLTFYFFAFDLERTFTYYQVYEMADSGYGDVVPQVIGHAKFFALYFFSMILGDLPTVNKHKDNPSYASLGASGATSGVVLAMILLMPTSMNIFGIIPGWIYGLFFVISSYFQAKNSSDGINHEAHLYGALTGVALTFLFYPVYAMGVFGKIFGGIL